MTESLLRFIENTRNTASQIVEDLARNVLEPLSEIRNSVEKMLKKEKFDVQENQMLADIAITSSRISGIVSNVIDTIAGPSNINQPNSPFSDAPKRQHQ